MRSNLRIKSYVMFAGLVCMIVYMTAICVFAQEVEIEGPACTFQVFSSPEEDAKFQTKEVQTFQLFGRAGEDLMLVRIAGEDGYGSYEYISKAEMQSKLPELDCDLFPNVDQTVSVGLGSVGGEVMLLQETLSSLGMLEGRVDSDYGYGTANAVKIFQKEHGLEETGEADVYTMMLITALYDGLEECVTVSVQYNSTEEKFPEIAGKTDADLEKYMDSYWHFRFDAFEDAGTIDPSVALGYFEIPSPDIDTISGSVSVQVLVKKDDASGRYTLTPAIVAETEGSYRPYLQGAYLTGDGIVCLEGGSSTSRIEGITLKETGFVPLTEEAIAMLRDDGVQGIRLVGKNTEYDLELDINKEKLTEVMEAIQQEAVQYVE